MIITKRENTNFLFSIMSSFFLLLCTGGCTAKENSNPITSAELIKNGYKYIIFSSQNSLELYDLEKNTFQAFLKKNGQRFSVPVVTHTGKGYCFHEPDITAESVKTYLIIFDLKTKRFKQGDELNISWRGQIVASPDNQRIAFTCRDNNSIPSVRIYNVITDKLEKHIPIEDRFSQAAKLVWKPDNKSIVLWETAEIRDALEIDITTGKTRPVYFYDFYPLGYFQNKFELAYSRAKYTIYLNDLEKNVQYELKGSWPSIKFSRDGKYLIAGRWKGKGVESLAIIDTGNLKRVLQIKPKNHPHSAFGIDLW